MDKVGRYDAVAAQAAERRRGARLGRATPTFQTLDLLAQRHLAVAGAAERAQIARIVGPPLRVRHDVVALKGGLEERVAKLAAPEGARGHQALDVRAHVAPAHVSSSCAPP